MLISTSTSIRRRRRAAPWRTPLCANVKPAPSAPRPKPWTKTYSSAIQCPCDTESHQYRATYSREQGIARDLRKEAAISLRYRLLHRRLPRWRCPCPLLQNQICRRRISWRHHVSSTIWLHAGLFELKLWPLKGPIDDKKHHQISELQRADQRCPPVARRQVSHGMIYGCLDRCEFIRLSRRSKQNMPLVPDHHRS
jgi:hypothetical protein